MASDMVERVAKVGKAAVVGAWAAFGIILVLQLVIVGTWISPTDYGLLEWSSVAFLALLNVGATLNESEPHD